MNAQISQFDIAEKPDPYGIAVTDDGAVWVTMVHSGAAMRLAADGTHTQYPVGQASRPSVVTAGHGGSAWFTRTEDDRVSVIASDGSMETYDLDASSGPFGLCRGPDGAVWGTRDRCRSDRTYRPGRCGHRVRAAGRRRAAARHRRRRGRLLVHRVGDEPGRAHRMVRRHR